MHNLKLKNKRGLYTLHKSDDKIINTIRGENYKLSKKNCDALFSDIKVSHVDVLIKTIELGTCDCLCHTDGYTMMHCMPCCYPETVAELDTDGCLILIKK